jgi:hypothetical protein
VRFRTPQLLPASTDSAVAVPQRGIRPAGVSHLPRWGPAPPYAGE